MCRWGALRSISARSRNARLHQVILVGVQIGDGFLQISNAAVRHFGGRGGTARGEIAGFHQHGSQTPQLRVERAARPSGASADDADVELAVC